MKDFLKEGFGLDGRRTGVSWDGGRLTLVQVRRSRKGAAVEKTLSLSAEEAASAGPRLEQEGFRLEGVTAVFPQRLSVTKEIDLPSRDPREVADMAALQACRQMPFSPEEILTDARILSSNEEGGSRVLLTVARREDVGALVEALRGAGLSPARLVPAAQASAAFFAGREPFLLVEPERSSTTLAVVQDGRTRVARSIPAGVSSIQGDPAAWCRRIVQEASDTLREAALPSRRIVLSGASRSREALSAALRQALPDVPVDAMDPAGEAPDFSILSAAGAAFMPEDGNPHLLPAEASPRAGRRERILCASLGGILLLSVLGLSFQRLEAKRKRIAFLDDQWKAVASQVRELQRIEEAVRTARGGRGEKDDLPSLLARLNRLSPPRIALTTVEYERGKSLSLQGAGFSLADAVNLVNALQKSGTFQSVELRSSNARSLRGHDVVEFQIDCRLSKGGAA